MTQTERIATSDDPSPARGASRSVSAPLIAVFIAAAFVASSWFFYQQGQRDAAPGNTNAAPVAVQDDAMTPQADTIAQQAATNDSAAISTAADGSAQSSVPSDTSKLSATQADTANAGTVAQPAAPVAKAKPAVKRSLALSAKPAAHLIATEPQNRDVALLGRPKPAYPSHALREREQGTVLVLAQVNVQGHVSDARVIQHSGSYALDRAATREVRNWQFQPALQNGQPVVASVQVPVSYRLEQ